MISAYFLVYFLLSSCSVFYILQLFSLGGVSIISSLQYLSSYGRASHPPYDDQNIKYPICIGRTSPFSLPIHFQIFFVLSKPEGSWREIGCTLEWYPR